jgi:hypothetical protein
MDTTWSALIIDDRFVVRKTVVQEFGRPTGSRGRVAETTDDESATIKLEVVVADQLSVPVARAILATARTRHPTASITISPVDEILEITFDTEPAGGGAEKSGISGRREGKGRAGS